MRVEHDLSNELSIWLHHSHLPEELLQILREVRSTSISRIHRYKTTNLRVQSHVLAHQLDLALSFPQTSLDHQDLLGACGEHTLLETVELIEAPPSAHLAETNEDTTHSVEIEGLIAIEDKHKVAQLGAQCLYGLSLTCTCWTEGSTTHS